MSYRVAVVCEDHTLEQYLVKPVVAAALAHVGKPRAVVRVVTDPRLKGISDLEAQLPEIANRYTAINDLLIVMVDADGDDGTDAAAQSRRQSLIGRIAEGEPRERTEVVVAVQELEVWAVWGVRSDLGASWSEVRAERDPKERFFDPQTTEVDERSPGRGRTRLIKESLAAGWASISGGCPELKEFENCLRRQLA